MDSLDHLLLLLQMRDKLVADLVYAAPEELPRKKLVIRKIMRRVVMLIGRIKWVDG